MEGSKAQATAEMSRDSNSTQDTFENNSNQRANYTNNYRNNNANRNYNNGNTRNFRNNYNNNRNNNGRGGINNNFNRQQRHQDRARAALDNKLVECALPSIPLTADGKVYKQIITEGTGPTPSSTSVLSINYVCRLSDGSVLDAFVDPQLPTQLNLNKVTLTPALEKCVAGMKIGEKCILSTSFEYGYGELGCPHRIPPKANLQYEIELFWFTEDSSLLDDGTVTGKLAVAEQAKLSGNHFYKLKMHRAAVRSYKYGESRLQRIEEASEEEQKKIDELIVLLNLNLAASALQTRLFDIALINCDKVLTLDPSNVKGLFRLARAYTGKGEYKSAKENLVKAIKLSPNDSSLREEYENVKTKEKNSEGGLRGVFNKENTLEIYTEQEKLEMQRDRIALANARMFV